MTIHVGLSELKQSLFTSSLTKCAIHRMILINVIKVRLLVIWCSSQEILASVHELALEISKFFISFYTSDCVLYILNIDNDFLTSLSFDKLAFNILFYCIPQGFYTLFELFLTLPLSLPCLSSHRVAP